MTAPILKTLPLLALVGCWGDQLERARDRDADGFPPLELGGPDCDDDNAAVYPGAPEICGNGIDDDCSGFIDDAGTGDVTYFRDGDGDGFPGSTPFSSCSAPAGTFSSLAVGADCDDTNIGIHPGAPEVWYDGIDSNCDGNDADRDGDGVFAVEAGGTDCDDDNADVRPGVPEVCNNGIDDDCDGGPGPCVMAGTIPASALEEQWISAVGEMSLVDVTGDGFEELVVASGAVTYALERPVLWATPSISAAAQTHISLRWGTQMIGDLNGDGVGDAAWADSLKVARTLGPLPREPLNGREADPVTYLSAVGTSDYSHLRFGDGGQTWVLRRREVDGDLSLLWGTSDGANQVVAEGGPAFMTQVVSNPFGEHVWVSVAGTVAPLDMDTGEVGGVSLRAPTGYTIERISTKTWEGESWLFVVLDAPSASTLYAFELGTAVPTGWDSAAWQIVFPEDATLGDVAQCMLTDGGIPQLLVGVAWHSDEHPGRRESYGVYGFDWPSQQVVPSEQRVFEIEDTGVENLFCADVSDLGADQLLAGDAYLGFTSVLSWRTF